jgi:hypothetical protein
MTGQLEEVLVRSQEQKVVADAQLSQKSIDRLNLQSLSPASVSKFSCLDVVFTTGHNERQY